MPIALEEKVDSCAVAMNSDFAADKEGFGGASASSATMDK
jgi:hypothetical protein